MAAVFTMTVAGLTAFSYNAGATGPVASSEANAGPVGNRVEDVSKRDAFSRTFVNADGSQTTETTLSPQHYKDERGEWLEIDPSLVLDRDSGSLAARGTSMNLEFSAGGNAELAQIRDAAESPVWRWDDELPAPTVRGNEATYEGVALNGAADLVVTSLPTGFSYDLVLPARPQPRDLEPVPLVVENATVDQKQDGSMTLRGLGNETVAHVPTPVMWDSGTTGVVDEPVNISVEQDGDEAALTILPDREFLLDEETVYPVTIDPTFTLTPMTDRTISSRSVPFDAAELRVGTYDGGTTKFRSFIKFNAQGQWTGKAVSSAQLRMRNFESPSCNNAKIWVRAISSAWTASSLSWSNQPRVESTFWATYSGSHGASGCAAADAPFDVTDAVRAWADGTLANEGFRLRANYEDWNNSYRKYRSSSSSFTSTLPRLIVNYDDAATPPAGLKSALVALGKGTATSAQRQLVIQEGYGNTALDASMGIQVTTVDEDDIATQDDDAQYPSDEDVPTTFSSVKTCQADDADCLSGTTTSPTGPIDYSIPAKGSDFSTDYEAAPRADGAAEARRVSRCASGHRARRYTVTLTGRGPLGGRVYEWAHRVHYCTDNGRVTKWRGRYNFLTHTALGTVRLGKNVLDVRGAVGGRTTASTYQRHLKQCFLNLGCPTDMYPWSTLFVDAYGGKDYDGYADT